MLEHTVVLVVRGWTQLVMTCFYNTFLINVLVMLECIDVPVLRIRSG